MGSVLIRTKKVKQVGTLLDVFIVDAGVVSLLMQFQIRLTCLLLFVGHE